MDTGLILRQIQLSFQIAKVHYLMITSNRFTRLNLLVIAVCEPACENQGICIRPNVCHCPEGWEGSQCQIKMDKPCPAQPPAPSNSNMICDERLHKNINDK